MTTTKTDWEDRLNAALTYNTLTAEMLSEAVRAKEDTDMGPISIGTHWLFFRRPVYKSTWSSRPEKYVQRAPDVFGSGGIDAEKFFRDHLDVREFACWATHNADFLQFLPKDKRHELVREAYLKHGGSDDELVETGLAVGISRDQLAAMMTDHFATTPYRSGVSNDIDDFLEYGLEQTWDPREQRFQLPEDAPWAMFNDDSLENVLMICAAKSPLYTLKEQKKIEIRLGREAMRRICGIASRHITELPRWLELDHFYCLTAVEMDQIVSRVDASDVFGHKGVIAGLIILVALNRLTEEATIEYLQDRSDDLDKINAVTVFMTARRIIQKQKNKHTNAELILDLLFVRLRQAGYIVGAVEEEFHTGKRGRKLQYVVNYGGKKYIHDDGDHRWFPKAGDRVIVGTHRARALTPYVFLSYFNPLDKEVR
jgi:hypothetical protein